MVKKAEPYKGVILKMDSSKSDFYLILFFVLAVVMVGLNELGYGVFALLLLFPAIWLMAKAFGK